MPRRIHDVQATLREFLEEEGESLGLGRGPFHLGYVPNPGGFVNANFCVRSEQAAWHCKLAYPDCQPGVRRWWELRRLLAERYRSPEVLAWIDLGTDGLAGIIVEHVPGVHADYTTAAKHWSSVSAAVELLHRDSELAVIIGATDKVGSCLGYLEDTYLEMLEEDIEDTRDHEASPPFVGAQFWDWAMEEVHQIRTIASSSSEFHQPADTVVHGDLWEGNVLVSDNDWWIVDWDELGFGDPAKDLTDWWRCTTPPLSSGAVQARLPIWGRLRLLVDAVDTLADWAEAVVAPDEVRDGMRTHSRTVHEAALDRYRLLYGLG